MKQISRTQHNIAQFEIVITLLSARGVGKSKNKLLRDEQSYLVQLQKGPQLIKSIETKLLLNADGIFLFEEKIYHKIRNHNRKTVNFSVSIYKEKERMFQLFDTFPLEIQKAFSSYSLQLSENAVEYSNLIKKKNHQELQLNEWQAFAGHLSKSRQYLAAKNESNSVQIRYSVQIINQLDAYVQNQVPKQKLKTKKSNVSKRSSSSRNSKTSKYINKQQSSTSTLQKSDSRGALQSKFILPPLKQFYHVQSNVINQQERVIPLESKESNISSQIQTVLHTPLPVHSILKKNENLSDIIQASYEGQSNFNSGNKSQKKQFQMPQIQEQATSNLHHRKSQLFSKTKKNNEQDFRRINSLPFQKASEQRQLTPQTSGGTMNEHVQVQQETYQERKKQKQSAFQCQKYKQTRKGEIYYLLMLMLVCIGFGFISYSQLEQKNKNKVKKQKQRFLFKKSKIIKPNYHHLHLNQF